MTTVTEAAVLSATASTTLLKILIKKHDRSLSGLLKAPDSYEETFIWGTALHTANDLSSLAHGALSSLRTKSPRLFTAASSYVLMWHLKYVLAQHGVRPVPSEVLHIIL